MEKRLQKFNEQVTAFLKKYALADDPNLDDQHRDTLMNEYYYVIAPDLGGYFLMKDMKEMNELDEFIYAMLYNG